MSLISLEQPRQITHRVSRMLMRRSQLQPVMNAAAAGGKRIATCAMWMRVSSHAFLETGATHDDEEDVRASDHDEYRFGGGEWRAVERR